MSPPGCQKMSAKPCNRNAEESFPVLSLKSREQKPPNSLLIQDKNVLQPTPRPILLDVVAMLVERNSLRAVSRIKHCKADAALRIAVPQPTPGRKWQQRTPAMAAELTDHIWGLEELLSYRVPPP